MEKSQPRLLYPARISFKSDGEISFSDKQKLREFSTTKSALQQMLKGLHSQEIQEKKKYLQNEPQTIKKMTIGTYISIITLNVNQLSAPSKRHRLVEWIQKQDPYICCLQETHFRPKETYRLKVRRWKNIFHANEKQKKARVAILISHKIDLKIKITRDKEGHYIMIKASIQEEKITIVNIYALNIGAPQNIRQTLTDIKGAIDSNPMIVGDFNTPLTPMDRSKQKLLRKHKS